MFADRSRSVLRKQREAPPATDHRCGWRCAWAREGRAAPRWHAAIAIAATDRRSIIDGEWPEREVLRPSAAPLCSSLSRVSRVRLPRRQVGPFRAVLAVQIPCTLRMSEYARRRTSCRLSRSSRSGPARNCPRIRDRRFRQCCSLTSACLGVEVDRPARGAVDGVVASQCVVVLDRRRVPSRSSKLKSVPKNPSIDPEGNPAIALDRRRPHPLVRARDRRG